jgi:histidine triad (HIT) family protein
MADCLFCRLVAGEIPCNKAYEDDEVLAFHDIQPQTPVHILIIPKAHVAAGAADVTEENCALVGRCFAVAAKLAKEYELASGFRIVTNNGAGAGQTVPHLHFHLLGGRELTLPLG